MSKNSYKEKIINKAIKYHLEGSILEATKYYKYCINQDFNDERVFSNYGAILQNLGKLKEAKVFYLKAIELNPRLANAHSNLGNILRILGELKEAELSTRKAIKLNPNFAEANNNLGIILRELGKLEEAEISYRKAIKLKPDLANAHSNLGNVLRELGKLEEAEISYRKAIKLKPDLANAHSNLGNVLRELGKLKEAEIYTRKEIELNPNISNAHLNLGNVLRELGKLKEAEICTRKAIKLKPDLAEAYSNLGIISKDIGKLKEAEIYSRKAIKLKPDLAEAYSNLGDVLGELGKLKEAEIYTRKAIKIKPDLALSHSNLGVILINLGKLKEAELSIHKSIEIKPDLAKAFFDLSTLKVSTKDKKWRDQLFSKNLISNKSLKDQIDIYFARANILHKESNFKESSKYLKLGNNLKQKKHSYNPLYLINKSKELLEESYKESINKKDNAKYPQCIFIVGMPRSGSTLLESILSMNIDIYDLGEINILEEAFLNWKTFKQNSTLAELYLRKIINHCDEIRNTTNKWLYNYLYTGIISTQIPNAKIIHCFRNPLDNIFSIYRAHFKKGNQYSSSLVDCAKIYLDQDKVMTQYKNKFTEKIFDLNYDSLVSKPKEEIKSLISWLGWKWDDKYLSPHLNPRSVSTASNVQVRSPINSKSIGGWKNYKEMLKPAIEILTQTDKYQDIIS